MNMKVFLPKWRVARWYIFRPKIQIWVNFGVSCKWKMSVNFMTIWSIFLPFGIFYGLLVYFSSFSNLYQEKSGNSAEMLVHRVDTCLRSCGCCRHRPRHTELKGLQAWTFSRGEVGQTSWKKYSGPWISHLLCHWETYPWLILSLS
jgi:hypothetical protein